jgi:hypothetical protein
MCIMRYDYGEKGEKQKACVARTCDRQFNNCKAAEMQQEKEKSKGRKPRGSSRSAASNVGPHVRDHRTPAGPLTGGILQQDGGFSSQGPATAGAAVAPRAPAAPPVILR